MTHMFSTFLAFNVSSSILSSHSSTFRHPISEIGQVDLCHVVVLAEKIGFHFVRNVIGNLHSPILNLKLVKNHKRACKQCSKVDKVIESQGIHRMKQ